MFMGIIINTKASKKSTTNYKQFQALQTTDLFIKLDISTKGQTNVQFRIGTAFLIGTIHINSPIGKIQFHVI